MKEIEKFVKRVEAATKARSKEIRLNIQEAKLIALEIAQLLIKENQLLEKINNLQDGKTETGGDPYKDMIIQATIDGGKFDT